MSREQDYQPSWFVEFKAEVSSRLSRLETEIRHLKEGIDELKFKITDIDKAVVNLTNCVQIMQNRSKAVASSWKQVLVLITSIVGSVVLATYLAYLLSTIG